ncbi:MAG: hypothetical protein AB8I08_32505 [Sandaracinaceae bacterium]
MAYSVQLGDDLFAFAERRFGETEVTLDVQEPPGYGIQLRLEQLETVAAVEPWPSLHVAWKTKHLTLDRTLSPPERRFGDGGPTNAQRAHEEMVLTVVEQLRASSAASAVERGWTAFDVVPWEQTQEWPDDAEVGDGAFRTAADADPVVARRASPSPLESLLVWLASSPDKRLVNTPREVVLTREQLYARFSDDVVRRLPRDCLRARRGPPDKDAVYLFGRRTRLVLPHRDGCPVREALDAQLAEAT